MNYLIKIITVVTILLAPLFANVGSVTALRGDVKIQNASVEIAATLGATLNAKDHVITASRSKAQLIFKDDTIVTVGKNSDFSIARYLYDESSEPTVEFGLIRGAMRTITGKIGKIAPKKFKVKTNNATIGIRGTNFTVVAGGESSLRAYCTYGAIHITYNNKAYTVKQGYFIQVNKNGVAKVKTFSAGELNEQNNKSFGKEKVLNGSSNEDGSSAYSEVGLDVTVEEVSDETQQAVTQSTQDSIQTATSADYVTMVGHSIDTDSSTSGKSLANLRFTADGSAFDTTNSWVEVQEKNNGYIGQDNWKFYLASTPTAFTSKDEFQTTFSSVSLTPLNESSSTNGQIVLGSFSASEDYAKDDYMSWGSWNAKVSYRVVESGTPTTKIHNMQGLWVTGEATSKAVVDALTGSNVSYSGKYNALNLSDSATVTGTAKLIVNFGLGRSANLTINYENGDSTGQTTFNNMSISGNTISGSQTSGPGSANGTFYGPNGKSIGGNFSYGATTQVDLKGVYQVTQIVE